MVKVFSTRQGPSRSRWRVFRVFRIDVLDGFGFWFFGVRIFRVCSISAIYLSIYLSIYRSIYLSRCEQWGSPGRALVDAFRPTSLQREQPAGLSLVEFRAQALNAQSSDLPDPNPYTLYLGFRV